MAEEKKKPEGWNLDPIEALIIVIFLAALAGMIPMVWSYIASGELSFFGLKLSGLVNFFKNNVQIFKILGYALAGSAAIATFVLNKRSDAIWAIERAKVYPQYIPKISTEQPQPNPLEERWKKIVEKSNSQNPADWRWAIIEADIILAELLDKLQLPGSTIGEKLKAVEPSDFLTIDLAWEAHKARNAVAHQGGDDLLLNQRETRRIISLYEAVFKEFELI